MKLNEFDNKIGLVRGKSKFVEIIWYFFKMLFFLSSFPWPYKFKSFILILFGARIGKDVVIKPRVNIHFPWKLHIGDYSWIGEEVFILNFESVYIGENCCISQRSFLCGGNHDFRDINFKFRNGPITIKNKAWVGAFSFIGPNVVIGSGSVVAAGSVLTKSVDENGIYQGNPAIFVGKRWK